MNITIENDGINKNSFIYKGLQEAEKRIEKEIPVGYMEVNLSTKGLVGAPASFHIRNFKTEEILALSLTPQNNLASKLLSILKDMIFEDDVDPKEFHISEIEETLLYIYMTFFSPTFEEVIFPIDKSDLDYLESHCSKEDFEQKKKDIAEGKWVPKTDINIQRDVDTYDISSSFKKTLTIKNKKNGFSATFRYLKYSDQIIINDFLRDAFANDDFKFKNVDINKMPPELEEAFQKYREKKAIAMSLAYNYCSIIELNGMDLSDASLSDKFKMCSEDIRFDGNIIAILNSAQGKQPFGLKPEVRMYNPITNMYCTRRFPFQISAILSACILYEPDWDDGGDGNESEYIVE